MALNPFFLQGSQSEQRLVQDLINEHLTIYGVEVTYIPRKMVNRATIIEEVTSSKYDDNFSIEAYVNNFDGYSGQGDIMTKFGVSLKDELTISISKERFEDFISAFLGGLPDDEVEVWTRPREGDLVYFPLGGRLFEVKFVEHEQPFYQLGKNYIYELQCELFEYEDEVIDTSIDAIDEEVKDTGFITTLNLIGSGTTATATANLSNLTGYIREISLTNDGSGYTSVPTVAISSAPSVPDSANASAVAITTTRAAVTSIERIVLTHAGNKYTTSPTITILGGGGSGAIATCSVETTQKGVVNFTMVNNGEGYGAVPTVVITGGGTGIGSTAIAEAVTTDNRVTSLRIPNPGIGYTQVPTVTISNPSTITGVGTYYYNEVVRGLTSLTEARVKGWDQDTKVLKVSMVGIGATRTGFIPGEVLIGTGSTIAGQYASYTVKSYDGTDIYDKYDSNDEIESEADSFLDFSQSNPFGTY